MLKLIKFFSFLFVSIFIYDVTKIVFVRKTLKTAIDLRRKLNPVIKIRLPPPCELDEGIFSILSILTLFSVSTLLSFRLFEVFRIKEKCFEFFFTWNLHPVEELTNVQKQEKSGKVNFISFEHEQVPQKDALNDSEFVSEQNGQKEENKIYDPIINELKEIEYSRQCDVDRFEERLEAVESKLKSTKDVTKEWGERIDQAENDLISLHTQFEVVLKSTWNGSGDNKGNDGFEIDWKDDLRKDVKKQIEEVQNKCSLLRNLAFSDTEKLHAESIIDFTKFEHF